MTRATWAAIVSLLLASSPALARPAHKRALADHFGSFLARKLNDCRTCHLPDQPGAKEDDDKPHNPFGARLKDVRSELRKAGKKTDIADRLDAIANEDSDSDGVPNLIELLTGHSPGDPSDKPSADEMTKAKQTRAAFLRMRTGYPWRPFEVVQRPSVPKTASMWLRNPIDVFITVEHERVGLKPRPEAPPAVLLRRVYLDLIGLPPTRAELHAFLEDQSPRAYEKVVERLLADPRYGERWGRHWMDVWRYSDWEGYGPQVRDSQPHIWHWRDWIIESLNQDKGYDRMILEMLAGDELAPQDDNGLRGTGYLVRNFKLLSREKWMQDVVEHTFMAFQGVTIGCARCHDHMFDPILQTDYYRLRAIFEPHKIRTDRLPGQPDIKKGGLPRAYDADLDAATLFFIRGDDRTPDKNKKIIPGVPDVLGGAFKVEPVTLPRVAYAPESRDFVVREELAAVEAAVKKAEAALAQAQGEARDAADLDHRLALARREALTAVLQAEKLEERGQRDSAEWKQAATAAVKAQREAAFLDAQRKHRAATKARAALGTPTPGKPPAPKIAAAEKALAAAAQALTKAEMDLKAPPSTAYTPHGGKSYPKTSTGRRLALARWLASKDNPLAARVAVNHIWLRHFGQALVPTVFDFGRNGRRPTHPELLDWLAAEFMESGWSMKHLHRLIVISSTYRLASTPDPDNLRLDRDNVYLWRHAPRRVEAEVVRDMIFHLAGRLDSTMSGPDIPHEQGLTTPRRSLYFQHTAEKQMEFLQLFDAASVSECYERKHSIIPQQALALANSELARKHGRLLARALHVQAGSEPAAFVTAAFEQVLTRRPTVEELTECVTFLRQREEQHRQAKLAGAGNDSEGRAPSSDPVIRARESLVHVLLNHHEFVTVR
ncbi:MAG: DUF1549 and DUF1553 domain-containing protein [Gemmataceae bacterium]|nr:DUF1549 and DUF1553 domain-containing protein [Gemmataceae bacterium]